MLEMAPKMVMVESLLSAIKVSNIKFRSIIEERIDA